MRQHSFVNHAIAGLHAGTLSSRFYFLVEIGILATGACDFAYGAPVPKSDEDRGVTNSVASGLDQPVDATAFSAFDGYLPRAKQSPVSRI
jgi:hypothetical protein